MKATFIYSFVALLLVFLLLEMLPNTSTYTSRDKAHKIDRNAENRNIVDVHSLETQDHSARQQLAEDIHQDEVGQDSATVAEGENQSAMPTVPRTSTQDVPDKMLTAIEYNEGDHYVDPYRPLEPGQSRIFLPADPSSIDASSYSENTNMENEPPNLDPNYLEPGQYRVMLDTDLVDIDTTSQNEDDEIIGDPYYLEPGQYRVFIK